MKYALCISGFMRLFRQSMRYLRHSFLDAVDCDLYVSTWNVAGNNKYKFSKGGTDEAITPEMLRTTYGHKLKNAAVLPYDPASVTPGWLGGISHLGGLHQRLASMYYHIWNANELKLRSGRKYDLTIRCRSDLFFETKVADLLGQPCDERKVFVPESENYGHVNDQFMFGPSDVMDTVAGLYTTLTEPQPFWTVEPAEKTLADYLAAHGIEARRLPIRYKRVG